jgi:hypothetical protein
MDNRVFPALDERWSTSFHANNKHEATTGGCPNLQLLPAIIEQIFYQEDFGQHGNNTGTK